MSLLHATEAASYAGVSERTLRKWTQAGRLHPTPAPGGRSLYDTEELDRARGPAREGEGLREREALRARLAALEAERAAWEVERQGLLRVIDRLAAALDHLTLGLAGARAHPGRRVR